MRILHINCNYIGTTLHQLMIEELDKLGFENEVFVPTYDKDIAVIQVNSNVTVSECFRKWDRVFFDYKQKKIIQAIEKNYDVSKFDLIHAYTLFTDGNAARVLSEKYGVPYVVAVRNTDVNTFFKKMIPLRSRGIRTMMQARHVFFLSPAYKGEVFSKYVPSDKQNAISSKTSIIPNGIDDFWFQNENEKSAGHFSEDTVKLVYAGNIDHNKNIETTQAAMKLLAENGVRTHLTVVGRVKDEKICERVKSDHSTTVLPPVSKDQLLPIYRAADIFVMPSFTESFGLVYAEAMSQGLPVIYSAGQGFDGQFPDGHVGYAVDPHSAESVAEGITQAISHIAELQKNVINSARRFCWSEIIKNYAVLYQSI